MKLLKSNLKKQNEKINDLMKKKNEPVNSNYSSNVNSNHEDNNNQIISSQIVNNEYNNQNQIINDQHQTRNNLNQIGNNQSQHMNNQSQRINNQSQHMNNQSQHMNNDYRLSNMNNFIPPERKIPISQNLINVSTRGDNSDYQRIGVLYSEDNNRNKPIILPLYGKPMYLGSSKWFYYTSTEDYHSVKVPIFKDGQKCQGSYGCNELYDNDLISVKPYKCKFRVSLYELEQPQYIPNIY
jgi:hypothetical protein